MRIKLIVEYDGADFCGWQFQPGLRTVQAELEKAILSLSGENVRVTASGRTDAGVHALGQVVHFDMAKDMTDNLVSGLNHFLPPDIRVMCAEKTNDDFHARFSAKRKTYKYIMYEGAESALLRSRAVRVENLDVEAMSRAASEFAGAHDFSSFRSTGSDALTTERTVYEAEVVRDRQFIVFTVTADGFLYNMVRKMAAALIEIGSGRMDIARLKRTIEGEPFTKVAPAKGLYLYKVVYEK